MLFCVAGDRRQGIPEVDAFPWSRGVALTVWQSVPHGAMSAAQSASGRMVTLGHGRAIR